jgi:hypothetical protein
MNNQNTPYKYQEFPKCKYHPRLPVKTVQNAAEEKALGRGWYNNPGDAAKAAEPSRIVLVLDRTIKPWWMKWQWIVTGCGAIVALIGGIIKLWR